MKKFDSVMQEIVKSIKENKVDGKITRTKINEIVNEVCFKMDFKGNEFSIFYSLGLA